MTSTTSAVLASPNVARDSDAPAEHAERIALELALESGQLGPWEWNIQEGVVKWSPAIERMHGIPVGSFDGTFEAYKRDIHPEDVARVLAELQVALQRKTEHHLLYRIIRPDGETRWLEANGRFVLDKNGEVQRLIGVCRDVTERKSAEEANARAELGRSMAEIIDGISDPFSVMDRELRVVFCNHASAKLLGTTPDTLVGKTPGEIISGIEDSSFVRAYRKVLETQTPLSMEDYFAPLDRWYEVSIYPLRDGLATYSRDVTERKRVELLRARLTRHEKLRAEVSAALANERDTQKMLSRCCELLVGQLGVSFARVWTADNEGKALLLQASAGKYTHIDGPHAVVPIGKFKIGRIAEERLPHLTNDVQHDPRVGNPEWAKREGMVAFAGYPLVVDDQLVGVMAMFATEPLPEETLHALGGVADTIAQGVVRRRAELELQDRARDLQRSNADLEQFAYVASHDLQEPLRMVSSYVQLLSRRYKGRLDADADEFIAFAVEGATRMQRLINDLLSYSRVGRRGRDFGPVRMDAVAEAAKQNLAAAIFESGAEVTVEALPEVVGDEGQLTQLLQNLMGNGIKFRGREPPCVHVSGRREGSEIVFSVRDNGIGIEKQYFERVFVIFQRLNPREQFPGTGIGLALSKKIVERHGGRIWLDSAPGAGSTVFFSLPMNQRRSRT